MEICMIYVCKYFPCPPQNHPPLPPYPPFPLLSPPPPGWHAGPPPPRNGNGNLTSRQPPRGPLPAPVPILPLPPAPTQNGGGGGHVANGKKEAQGPKAAAYYYQGQNVVHQQMPVDPHAYQHMMMYAMQYVRAGGEYSRIQRNLFLLEPLEGEFMRAAPSSCSMISYMPCVCFSFLSRPTPHHHTIYPSPRSEQRKKKSQQQ